MAGAMEQALLRLGVEIRREPLVEGARLTGGLCTLSGRPVLILPDDASLPERLAVLADALRRLPTDDLWLAPAVRRILADRRDA